MCRQNYRLDSAFIKIHKSRYTPSLEEVVFVVYPQLPIFDYASTSTCIMPEDFISLLRLRSSSSGHSTKTTCIQQKQFCSDATKIIQKRCRIAKNLTRSEFNLIVSLKKYYVPAKIKSHKHFYYFCD